MMRRVEELVERVRSLEHSVNGNGQIGLAELVRNQVASGVRLERALAELKTKVDGLLHDRDLAAAERQGSDKKLAELKRIVVVVGAVLAGLQTGGVEAVVRMLRELMGG